MTVSYDRDLYGVKAEGSPTVGIEADSPEDAALRYVEQYKAAPGDVWVCVLATADELERLAWKAMN